MNAQAIFNKVCRHLKKQNKHSKDPISKHCVYRSSNGYKCAIGCLIKDKEYNPSMELNGITTLILDDKLAPASLRKRLGPHIDLLEWLQCVHDNNAVDFWEYY